MMFEENVAKIRKGTQRGTVDGISELPEFILHNILSNLDIKEAGRASLLSKRWYEAWSSVPVLDFRLQNYNKEYWDSSKKYGFRVDDDVIQSFLGFIDRTMQRYDTQKYRIWKVDLQLPLADKKIEPLVDKWIRIAVQNQVVELYINALPHYSSSYRLPEILFRSKSLKVLNCRNVVLPYYETMELISLEYLTLFLEKVDTDLLQRIVSFCPLVKFSTVSDLGKISLPWQTNEFIGSKIMQSKFKVSPLREFFYHGLSRVVTWPLNMNVAALKNLRKLSIIRVTITDDIVSKLAYGLVALQSLVLVSCSMLKCIMISSISLKELRIEEGFELMKVTIDAPNLIKFWYNCQVETSLSLTRVLDNCNAQLFPWMNKMNNSITTDWLVKLKRILEETNFFQSLIIELPGYLEIEVEEDQLRNLVTGPPYKLRELKLRQIHAWDCIESPVTALNGLFWICHPDVLSISTSSQYLTAELLLHILKCRVKHPLKSIEVEGINGLSLHSDPSEFRFRLSWL